VGGVSIDTIFPVRAQGSLVLFVAFSAQVRGVLTSTTTAATTTTTTLSGTRYTVQAIVTWCDPFTSSSCSAGTSFHVPCSPLCSTALDPTCGGTCQYGLDQALTLGAQGMLVGLPLPQQRGVVVAYLWLSTQSATAPTPGMRIVWLHPYNGLLLLASSGGEAATTMMSTDTVTLSLLGSWTHAQVFAAQTLVLVAGKPVRDAWAHAPSARPAPTTPDGWYFFQEKPPSVAFGALSSSSIAYSSLAGLVGQWLTEVRPMRTVSGWGLQAFGSQATAGAARLTINCTYLSCTACPTAQLRLLCHQAQDCVLGQCVGTIVQTRNVLCGLGAMVSTTSKHAIVTWRALHFAMTEIALVLMRGLPGAQLVETVTLRFPTESFYTMLCSSKGAFASMVALGVSIGHALMAGLTTTGGGGAVLNSMGGQLDAVGALAGEGVLKSTAVAGLIFNTITTSTLLPTMAMHRWLLCIANASTAGFFINTGESSLTVQFGDVGMDSSWGACGRLDGLRSLIAHKDGPAEPAGDLVTQFVNFVITLASGLGETVVVRARAFLFFLFPLWW